MALSDSQREIHSVEACAHEYFSQGFVKRENSKEYVSIAADRELKPINNS